MDTNAEEVRALLDRGKIVERVVQLARGEDRRDAALIGEAYWPDAAVDFGIFKGSFAEYLAWVVPGADAIANTQHVLGQTYVELDGDAAGAETHVIAYHRIAFGEEQRDSCIGGRYLDSFERRGGIWRIASRLMLYDWSQDWGRSADWSQGLMGMPFSDEHFAGRAVGDHSESFFGKAG